MKKENQRVALSKRMLKDGLMVLLQKKHIDNISISELCEKAQINRTTFYRHYQTPHDVLMEIEFDFAKEFRDVPMLPKDANDLRIYVVRMCEFVYENRELIKLFISNNMDRDFLAIFQNLSDSFLKTRTIRYKGRVADESTMRRMSAFVGCGGYALIRQWLVEGMPKTPEEIADLILGSFNRDVTVV